MLDLSGQPATGAAVTIQGEGWSNALVTDDQGQYTFPLLCSGTAVVQAFLPSGRTSAPVQVHLTGQNSIQLELGPELAGTSDPVAQQTAGRPLIVTSPADAGPGTFRQALLGAQPGDTITFDPAVFPPEDPATITLLTALDGLAQGQLTVDASNAGVILDGSRLPGEGRANGLTILSSGNRILGLQILHFPASGVFVSDAQDNQIGGAGPGEGNVLSGNWDGINLWGKGAKNNIVLGNYVGTDASGTVALGNQVDGVWVGNGAQHNLVGGASPAERNVISGNGSNGVVIDGGQYNTISGNYIGTDVTGTRALSNRGSGVTLAEGARDNLIGGAGPGDGNVISGNRTGVSLAGSSVGNNVVCGNYIGTDASGSAALGNQMDGVWVGQETQNNLIGGATAAERNLISGNGNTGVVIDKGLHNIISSNYIGTDVTGTRALANNNVGVSLAWGAQHNLIGGDAPGEGNLISGNAREGVHASQVDTRYNTVIGNLIGVDASGLAPLPNGWSGVNLSEGARDNIIGGATAGEANLIGANGGDGVTMAGANVRDNVIRGNYIGTDAVGDAQLGNQQDGIGVADGAGPNTIGPGNLIAYNTQSGVGVSGTGTVGNTITANAIYDNGGPGIEMGAGGNAEIGAPELRLVSSRVVRGTAPPGATVEVFCDEGEEGRVFVATTTAGADGAFAYTVAVGAFRGPNVLVTATDREGNTSAFSAPGSPATFAALRELPQVVAPTQVSTDPKVLGTNLGLALFCVLFFGLTSTVFNATLEDYRDEIVGGLARLVPRAWAERLRGTDRSVGRVMGRSRGRLLLLWLLVLLVTALIESFLDPTIGILSPERLALLLTLFLSAVVVSGLELASSLFAHRRWAPATRGELQVQWIGLALAIACVILSRALRFVPGYLYGIVGAAYLTPRLVGITTSGKRALLVLSAILAGSLLLWGVTAFLPPTLALLEPVLLTTFLIGLQGTFFQLFPLRVTEGGNLWSWRKGLWFAFFLVVFFCTYHFVLNPNGSDVQALQQNGVQTLAVLMAVFGLATLLLWLLLPFRLRRRRPK